MKSGMTIAVKLPDGDREVIKDVNTVELKQGGAIEVWDIDGELVNVYGPTGYHQWYKLEK